MNWGEVTIQAEYDDGPVIARTRILNADPCVLVSTELLDLAKAGELRGITVDADTVTISDDYGQRYIYRITGTVEISGFTSYEMKWAD